MLQLEFFLRLALLQPVFAVQGTSYGPPLELHRVHGADQRQQLSRYASKRLISTPPGSKMQHNRALRFVQILISVTI